MTPIMLMAIIVLVPVVIAIVLRVNAAVLFMSLCVGAVLMQFVSKDAASFASAVSPRGNVGIDTARLMLLLIPPVLTAVFMIHSIHGSTKVALNVIPAIGVGLLAALLIEPLLTAGTRGTLEHSSIWHQFLQAETMIV